MDYSVSAIMQKNVSTVSPTLTIMQLQDSLVSHQVTGFPVVDKNKLVGAVSRSDVVEALRMQDSAPQKSNREPSSESDCDAAALRVKDIMSTDVVTARPNDTLHDVADLMYRNRIHRIFIVENGELRGIITPFDFVRLYAEDRIGAEGRPCRTQDF